MQKPALALFFCLLATGASGEALIPGAVGSTWEYEVRDAAAEQAPTAHVVVRISGTEESEGEQLLRVETARDNALTRTELISADDRGVLCYRRSGADGNATSFQPPQVVIPGDVRVGSQWEVDGEPSGKARQQFVVRAEEQVRVPAGVFRAFRIECEEPWPVSATTQRWFAPGVGLVKEIVNTRGPSGRLLSHTTMMLTKFSATDRESAQGNPSAAISAGPTPLPSPHAILEAAADRDGPALTDFRSDAPNIFVRWSGENLPVDGTVRLTWIAEDVGDIVEPNFIVDQVERTVTTPKFGGRFTLSRPKDGWAAGKYRLELYVENDLLETVNVTIGD